MRQAFAGAIINEVDMTSLPQGAFLRPSREASRRQARPTTAAPRTSHAARAATAATAMRGTRKQERCRQLGRRTWAGRLLVHLLHERPPLPLSHAQQAHLLPACTLVCWPLERPLMGLLPAGLPLVDEGGPLSPRASVCRCAPAYPSLPCI